MHEAKYPVLNKQFSGKKLVYLDAACTYIRDEDFVRISSEYYEQFSSCAGDRESSYIGSLLSERVEEVRKDIKKFLNATAGDDIVFTASTTDAINMLAGGMIKNISTYIVSDIEHNSNYLPWLENAKKVGKAFHVVDYKTVYDREKFRKFLEGVNAPFLVALTHASNITGEIFDITPIVDVVHELGGYVFVDDAQFIPHNREDVTRQSIDFLAFSAHKIGGPTGIGVLYIREDKRDLIQDSLRIGGGTIKSLQNGTPHYKPVPEFLEGGVQNFAGILGLGHVIKKRILEQSSRSEHIGDLMRYFYSKFETSPFSASLRIISNPNGGMVTICPMTFHAIDFHQYCNYFFDGYIIAFRTGSFCADSYVNTYLGSEKNIMRFSFGVYNTHHDIDILFQALTQFIAGVK